MVLSILAPAPHCLHAPTLPLLEFYTPYQALLIQTLLLSPFWLCLSLCTHILCVALPLTQMCMPTHPSAPCCALPAIARTCGCICGSQTHFWCWLRRSSLAFVNRNLSALCTHRSDHAFRTHITGGHMSKSQLLLLLRSQSGVADGWWQQAGAERERKERKIRILKQSLASGLTG